MNKIKIGMLLFAFLCAISTRADSPLTSSDIYKAYSNNAMVHKTPRMGILNTELMVYLSNPTASLEVKVAIINKLGWDIRGKNNATLFLNYLKAQKGYQSEVEFTAQGSSADILCYAYLKAMDNYFEVKDALLIAKAATVKDPQSFTVNFITQLIQAQVLLDNRSEWCNIYIVLNQVKTNQSLIKDFDKKAVKIVFKYIKGYQKYCV